MKPPDKHLSSCLVTYFWLQSFLTVSETENAQHTSGLEKIKNSEGKINLQTGEESLWMQHE